MRRRLAGLACLMIVAVATAHAQPSALKEQARKTPGHWKVVTNTPARSSAAVAAMTARMNDIMALLRHDRLVDHPPGFTALGTISAHQASPGKMVSGDLRTIFVPHAINDDGSIGTDGKGEGLGFDVRVNNMSCALGDKTDFEDKQGRMYSYVAPESFKGMPMYRDNACILITKRPAPLTVPVARERVLRAAIANFQGNPPVASALERQLAAMSPAERAAPAIVDLEAITSYAIDQKVDRPLFAASEGKMTIRVMAPNPAFYDRTRPGDIQVIVVGFDCGGHHDSPWCAGFPGVFERIRDTVDWTALASLVR